MLNPSLFDVQNTGFKNRVLCVVCNVYYTRFANHEKVYTLVKKDKISLGVPPNLIFTKTVSSLFAFKNINNYLKKTEMKIPFFEAGYLIFPQTIKNTLHTTHYTLHTIFHNGVNCEI